jgi:hypothetical protein
MNYEVDFLPVGEGSGDAIVIRSPCANMTCCTWLREISEQRGSYV